jgi:saccharopine dehydrogenase-like NADP-dependent oxidoreductase
MKVLLLGASGTVGRRAARELIDEPDVDELVLGGRNEELLETVASTSPKTSVLATDLEKEPLSGLDRFDVICSCMGPTYLFEVACVDAAIGAGVHYVSLCDDGWIIDDVLHRDEAARDAGVAIVPGCGLSPGITNLLVAHAEREVGTIDEVLISLAVSSADAHGDASALHLLAALSKPARFLSDGVPGSEPGGSGPRLIYFPEPVGWVETFHSDHPEVRTLTRNRPDLRTLSFRIGLAERAAMDALRLSVLVGVGRSEAARRTWLELVRPLRGVLEQLPPRAAPWTAARVDVWGSSRSARSNLSFAVVDHLPNLAGVPVARTAVALGHGSIPPGVHPPDVALGRTKLLSELLRTGIRIAKLEPQEV